MNYSYALLGLALLSSCNTPPQNSKDSYDGNLIVMTGPEIKTSITLSDLTDSVKYVLLEMNDSCFLDDSYKVKLDGDNLFIESKASLYRFDLQTGRFLNKIGNEGQGPQEYIALSCYYVDRPRKQVGLIDRYRSKLLLYGYDGIFINALSIPESLSDVNSMEMGSDGTLLLNHCLLDNYRSPKYEYSLATIEENELKFKEGFIINKYNSGNAVGCSSYHPIGCEGGGDSLLFSTAYSDILYECKDGKLAGKYKVIIPTPFPDSAFLKKNKHMEWYELKKLAELKGFCSGIRLVSDIPQYTILDVGRYHLLWDKKRNEGILFPLFLEEIESISLSSILSTDGSVVVNPAFFYTSDKINEYLENGTNESLKHVIRTVTEESNPVVQILYYKEDVVGFLKKKYAVE